MFWKTVKPFSSDKMTSREEIILIENEAIVSSEKNTTQLLNTFFANVVANVNILEYNQCDPIAGNIDDPIIKFIVKYRNHPSMLVIREVCNRGK